MKLTLEINLADKGFIIKTLLYGLFFFYCINNLILISTEDPEIKSKKLNYLKYFFYLKLKIS